MTTWTLKCGGVEKSLAAWGLARPVRSLVSQGIDELSFEQPGAMDAEPVFARDAQVTLYRQEGMDKVQWFVGIVKGIERMGSGVAEKIEYRLVGPWWLLENLIFEQIWYLAVDPSSPTSSIVGGYKSHVILNQGFNGSKLTTGGQIAQAVQWAMDSGCPLQMDTTLVSRLDLNGGQVFYASDLKLPDIVIPNSEERDVMCAEVIRKMLRWSPDAVAWFDYTQSPPALKIARRADLTPATVDLTAVLRPEQIKITPRYDLLRPAVMIKYEQTNQVSGKVWQTLTRDIAPDAAKDLGTGDLKVNYRVGSLTATIDLQGVSENTTTASITCAAIQPDNPAWLKGHVPWLADSHIDGIVITTNGETRQSDLPRELTGGQIAPWMGFAAQQEEVTVTVSFQTKDDSGMVIGDRVNEVVTVKVTATDAVTGTFSSASIEQIGELVPTGLAQKIYDAVGTLQFDGSIVMVEEEVSGLVGVGKALNITGSRAEWSSMLAVVQSVAEDLETGSTTITFGATEHLGPSDLVELTRINRNRQIHTVYSVRDTGEGAGGGGTVLGKDLARESVTNGGGAYRLLTIANGNKSIVLDPTQLPADGIVQLISLQVCKNGVISDMRVLGWVPPS